MSAIITDRPDRPDARVRYCPDSAPELIGQAIAAVGTQAELASRVGMTRDGLRKLSRGQRRMSYPLQVTLECLSRESINSN